MFLRKKLLSSDQEVPGSIPGSFVGFFSSKVFHDIYGLITNVLGPCSVFGGDSYTLLIMFLYMVQNNFYKALTYKSLVIAEIKP